MYTYNLFMYTPNPSRHKRGPMILFFLNLNFDEQKKKKKKKTFFFLRSRQDLSHTFNLLSDPHYQRSELSQAIER